MDWMIENWYVVFGLVFLGAMFGIAIYNFISLPTDAQLSKVKEWLLLAVVEAERAMGGGTGAIKLRMVYGLFLDKFPWLVKVISFEQFSKMVDEALETMRGMLQNNKAVKEYISGE